MRSLKVKHTVIQHTVKMGQKFYTVPQVQERVSKWAIKWVQWSPQVKQLVHYKQMRLRCKQTSKWMSLWPITVNFLFSESQGILFFNNKISLNPVLNNKEITVKGIEIYFLTSGILLKLRSLKAEFTVLTSWFGKILNHCEAVFLKPEPVPRRPKGAGWW